MCLMRTLSFPFGRREPVESSQQLRRSLQGFSIRAQDVPMLIGLSPSTFFWIEANALLTLLVRSYFFGLIGIILAFPFPRILE